MENWWTSIKINENTETLAKSQEIIENEGAQRKIQHLAWVTFSNSWSTVVLNFKSFLNLGGPAGGLGHRKVATPMGARVYVTRKASLALQAWRVIWVHRKSWFSCYEIIHISHTIKVSMTLSSHTGSSWGWRLTTLRYVSLFSPKLSSWLFLWPKIMAVKDFFLGTNKSKKSQNSENLEKIVEN